MSFSVFIANLDFKISPEELQSELEAAGFQPKAIRLMTDKETGRPKGYGFVDFETEAEGKRAVDELDGVIMFDRNLKVAEAESNKRPRGKEWQPRREKER